MRVDRFYILEQNGKVVGRFQCKLLAQRWAKNRPDRTWTMRKVEVFSDDEATKIADAIVKKDEP